MKLLLQGQAQQHVQLLCGGIYEKGCNLLGQFHPIASSKSNKLKDAGCLTYSRMQELLKAKLNELGFPSTDFSIRSGEATTAARAVVPDRYFKRHGC